MISFPLLLFSSCSACSACSRTDSLALALRHVMPQYTIQGKEQDQSAEVESFFVTIDSIALDVKTGLWKKIMLSLMSMMVPRVAPQRAAAAAAGGATAAADSKSAK